MIRSLYALALASTIVVASAIPTAASSGPAVPDVSSPAVRATSTFAAGELTVSGTSRADNIAITCASNKVRINDHVPSSGPLACSAVQQMVIKTGAGNDTVDLSGVDGVGFPTLSFRIEKGGRGNDTLTGSVLSDVLLAGSGNDTLIGGDGADSLGGGGGYDSADISGNFISVAATSVTADSVTDEYINLESFSLEAKASTLCFFNASASPIPVQMIGDAGNDGFIGSNFPDLLIGGGGVDTMQALDGTDILQGGSGDDSLDGGTGTDAIIALIAGGPATLSPTQFADPSDPEGTDALTSIEGASVFVTTGTGTTVDASAFGGDTQLIGNTGNDTLIGAGGFNNILGGAGTNTLTGGPGMDRLWADGNGTLTLSDTSLVTPSGTSSLSGFEQTEIDGGNAADALYASAFSGSIVYSGGGGDDIVQGGSGNDRLAGGRGDDDLSGNAGDDHLVGGPGNDACVGGPGTDTLRTCNP